MFAALCRQGERLRDKRQGRRKAPCAAERRAFGCTCSGKATPCPETIWLTCIAACLAPLQAGPLHPQQMVVWDQRMLYKLDSLTWAVSTPGRISMRMQSLQKSASRAPEGSCWQHREAGMQGVTQPPKLCGCAGWEAAEPACRASEAQSSCASGASRAERQASNLAQSLLRARTLAVTVNFRVFHNLRRVRAEGGCSIWARPLLNSHSLLVSMATSLVRYSLRLSARYGQDSSVKYLSAVCLGIFAHQESWLGPSWARQA